MKFRMYTFSFILLYSLNSFSGVGGSGGGVSSTWSQLRENISLEIASPNIGFEAGAATVFVDVLDVCLMGDEVVTREPQHYYGQNVIKKPGKIEIINKKFLSKPIRNFKTVQIFNSKTGKFENIEKEEITETQYQIDVFEKILGTSRLGQKKFTKEYMLSDCSH